MIFYLINLIIVVILTLVLIKIFRNIFPTDNQIDEKKIKKIEEIRRLLEFGNSNDKKDYFEKLYKDKFAKYAYFLCEWEDYTIQIKNFSEDKIDFYEQKFKEQMFGIFLVWNEDDIKNFVKKYYNYWIESRVDNYRIFFMVLFLILSFYFSFSLYPILQNIAVSDALFASVYTIIAVFMPSLALGLIIFIPIYIFFIRIRLIEQKYSRKVLKNSGEININTRTYKIMYIFLVITAIVCILMYAFLVSYNTKIKDDGIYFSDWNTFDYKYYSWDEITHIYYSSGEDALGISMKTYYYLKTIDGNDIYLSSKNIDEINHNEKDMINFIAMKTGLNIEKR